MKDISHLFIKQVEAARKRDAESIKQELEKKHQLIKEGNYDVRSVRFRKIGGVTIAEYWGGGSTG